MYKITKITKNKFLKFSNLEKLYFNSKSNLKTKFYHHVNNYFALKTANKINATNLSNKYNLKIYKINDIYFFKK